MRVHIKRTAAVFLFSCLPVIVLAQASLTDFARGADIRADGGSLFRVLLPDDVYTTVTRPDLGDIRVLNAAGEAVPHSLRRIPAPATADADWIAVPSFPMSAAQAGGGGKTQVKVDATGAVVEVTGDTTRQSTVAYLVDASGIKVPLTRLALAWNAPEGVTFLTRVQVQASSDLNTWHTVVPAAAIAQLQRDALTLTQSEIELPASSEPMKYLRISWPADLMSVTLTSARVRPRAPAAQPDIRWRAVRSGETEPSGAFVYDVQGLFPVEYLDLDFADATDAASVTVLSRPDPSSPWQLRHGGLFYALQEKDGAVRSSPARIAPTTDRYWSVTRTAAGGSTQAGAPRLKVGWHPHELIFVARGAAPFTLAYGSARAGAADAPVDALLASLDAEDRAGRVRAATLSAPRDLGGEAALTPPAPVRRIVLWTVLVAAVAVLALLASRAFRDTPRT